MSLAEAELLLAGKMGRELTLRKPIWLAPGLGLSAATALAAVVFDHAVVVLALAADPPMLLLERQDGVEQVGVLRHEEPAHRVDVRVLDRLVGS